MYFEHYLLIIVVLSAEGVKLCEWNKTLKCPMTDMGVAKVMKAGFLTPSDVTGLLQEDIIEDLELSLRDKAALRRIIETEAVVESGTEPMATATQLTEASA